MGYRSEVALAVSKELMPRFLTVFAKCPEAQAMVFKDHDKMDEDYDGEGTVKIETAALLLLLMFSFGVSVALGARKIFDNKKEIDNILEKSEVDLP